MARSYRRLDETRGMPMDTDPTLDQLAWLYRRDQESRNLSANTLKVTENAFALFRRFLGDRELRLSDLSSDLFREYSLWLRDTPKDRPQHGSTARKPGGIANRMRVMRAFVKWLAAEGLLTARVVVKEPTIPREFYPVLSDIELAILFTSKWCNPDTEQGARNRSLFSLMLDTGLRVSEVGLLAIDDVLVDDRLLRVMGKGHKPRYVPFSRDAQADLAGWLKVRGKDNRLPVYELTVRSIQALFRDIELDLGFEFFPHKLRHSFASRALNNGVDVITLQRYLGHAQLTTTSRYVTLSTKDLQAKHEQVSPLTSFARAQSVRPAHRRRSLVKRR